MRLAATLKKRLARRSESSTQRQSTGALRVERFTEKYGDLVFDLCTRVLWSDQNAQMIFQRIRRAWSRLTTDGSPPFELHERSWALQVAVAEIIRAYERYSRKLSANERVLLDSQLDAQRRMNQIDAYFHRLPPEAQILLLLREKYGLSMREAGEILNTPERSIQMLRRQAFDQLHEEIWEET